MMLLHIISLYITLLTLLVIMFFVIMETSLSQLELLHGLPANYVN